MSLSKLTKRLAESLEHDQFAGRPELHPVHLDLVNYPPLARQTRISGTVVLRVFVASDGKVSRVDVRSGHPLLVEIPKETVLRWKFDPQPGEERSFELKCELTLSNEQPIQPNYVAEPFHLVIASEAVTLNTSRQAASSSASKRSTIR